MSPTRRKVLRTTGLALGGSVLGSLAGCLDGQTGSAGPATDEPASHGSFREWLVDPTTTPLGDGYGVLYHDLAGIRKRRDALHENAYGRLRRVLLRDVPARGLLDLENVSATLGLDFEAKIAFGSFDPDAFEKRLTEGENARQTSVGQGTSTGTSPLDTEQYRGFRLFDHRRVYAVSESVVLMLSPFLDEHESFERARVILDARLDGETRYPDGNEYVDAMLGLVDDTHALTCYPEATDGSTSRGFRNDLITGSLRSWRFGPEQTELTFANTYPDAEDVSAAEFEAYLESEADRFGPYRGLDVTTDGRMVWTDGTVPTGKFDYLSAGGPSDSVHTTNG